jgi:hypothetical protein
MGLWSVAAPAMAAAPVTENCVASGTPGTKVCGVVRVEVAATARFRCAPPGPGYCGETIVFMMRTRWYKPFADFRRVLEATAISEGPSACFTNATSSWSAWCDITTTSPPQSIRMKSVTQSIFPL